MGLDCYLAMTAAEFAGCSPLPTHTAWMSCHFSSSSQGLSNLPEYLPPKAMLIVDDSIPFDGHDPRRITAQLTEAVKALGCAFVLLDLQRPEDKNVFSLCRLLTEKLPCPVIVSESYAKDLACPVLLAPPPLLTELSDHLAPWKNREVWLEAAPERQVVLVTETGSARFPCLEEELPAPWFSEERLFCRYHWVLEGRTARFTLMRTKEDLAAMLCAAKDLGVKGAVGLYQELKEPVITLFLIGII